MHPDAGSGMLWLNIIRKDNIKKPMISFTVLRYQSPGRHGYVDYRICKCGLIKRFYILTVRDTRISPAPISKFEKIRLPFGPNSLLCKKVCEAAKLITIETRRFSTVSTSVDFRLNCSVKPHRCQCRVNPSRIEISEKLRQKLSELEGLFESFRVLALLKGGQTL